MSNVNEEFIVEIKTEANEALKITLTGWIKKVCSYKKGRDGLLLTLHTNEAHIYKSKKTALHASSYYGGTIIKKTYKENNI
jgi:hypothetical protein